MSDGRPSPEFIADLFGAAVDTDGWPEFSQLIRRTIGFDSVGVWIIENGGISDISVSRALKETERPYLAHFSKIDPWQRGMLRAPMETVVFGYETVPERELVKTEFYNDFARQAGLFRPMGAMMTLAPGKVATLAMEQPHTRILLEESDRPRLQALIPYVKRALQLRLRQRRQAPPEALGHALDSLAFGIVVCDAAGRVAFVNAAAETLARNGAGIALSARGTRIGALAHGETQTLAALVNDAANGGAGGVLRLTDRGGATGLIALVTPLPRGVYGERGPGYAMLALRPAWDSPAFSEAELTALFGLSPQQAAIALAVYNGLSPEQIAVERGIRITTLRTHLSQIFARTGAETQRDLVRLLGTLPPLRRP